MARSYKYPVIKQRNDKYFKRLSNKRIRKYIKKLNIGFKTARLKLLVDPWDICDWKFIPNKENIKIASRK